MKKIKYLIGAFVFCVGLLFSSQSFADTVYIDTVVDGSMTSSSRSANYLYKFSNSYSNYSASCKSAFFGYQLYYNGVVQFNYLSLTEGNRSCPAPFNGSFTLNNSAFGIDPFSSTCYHWYNRGDYYCPDNYGVGNYTQPITVWLGQGNNFGNNFLFVDNPLGGSGSFYSPKYGFGAGFLTNNDVLQVQSSASSYFRFFYNSLSDYTNPVDNFNIVSMNGSTQTGSIAWEYFYPKGTKTNYGYIVDDGQSYTKYKHFGLFDMGYSYTYGKVGQSATGLSWNQLGFRTVSDAVETFLKLFGSISYDDLNNGVGTSRLSWNGLLLLRGNQYVSFGNDDGVYILSKDPNNYSRVLYEHYSCSLSNIDAIFNGNSSVQSCVKLDGGYLTYNGNTSVLPFTDGATSYSITSVDSTYPLLYDLVNGGDGLSLVHGITVEGSSCLYINQFSRCYGFSSDSSVNIKETYLGSLPPSEVPISTGSSVVSFSSLYYQCLGPSYNTPDGLPPAFCLNPDGSLINFSDYENCYFTLSVSGDLMQNLYCNNNGYVQEMAWVGEGSGGSYTACYGENCGVMFTFGPNYLIPGTSFELSTGLIEDMFTNITGWVGRCPFPYTDFQLGKNSQFLQYLKTLGFKYDPFIFINCVVAGFNYGRHTIDNTLFGDTFDSPLLNGDTSKHRVLFTFLDFIVILGLFGLWGFVKKIF